MTVRCATCRHYPGRDALCAHGKRHATAQPKRCTVYRPTKEARHVGTLRGIAVSLLHDGDLRRYAATLNVAHDAAEAVRR